MKHKEEGCFYLMTVLQQYTKLWLKLVSEAAWQYWENSGRT